MDVSQALAAARAQVNKVVTQTPGSKLRMLALVAAANDPWNKPPMKIAPLWQPSTLYNTQGQVVVNGGNLYVIITTGTSASSGGPTGVKAGGSGGGGITDGTCVWTYIGPNLITQDPDTSTPAWTANTSYPTLGKFVVANGNVYGCVATGTSASGSGPTGTSNAVTDGTVIWTYVGKLAPNPYVYDWPVVTYTNTNPNTVLSNTYAAIQWGGTQKALYAWVKTGGSGYALNDTITVNGGTSTQATVLLVTGVSGGAVTSVSVQTAGAYTVPPTLFQGQASTSGSGTGATFLVCYTSPGWCTVLGGMVSPLSLSTSTRGDVTQIYTYQPVTQMTPKSHSTAWQFWTDAPVFAVYIGTSPPGAMFVNDVKYSHDIGTALASNGWMQVDFTAMGGSKPRKIRFENVPATRQNLGSVYVAPGYTVWATSEVVPTTVCFLSDSIYDGSSYHAFVAGNSMSLRISKKMGWHNPISLVLGGTGIINKGTSPGVSTDNYLPRVAQGAVYNPDLWVVPASVNDRGSNLAASWTVGSTTTIATTSPHGLTNGASYTFSGATGTGASLVNGVSLAVTVTGTTTFTVPVNSTGLTLFNGSFVSSVTGNAALVDATLALLAAIRAVSTKPIIVMGAWPANPTNNTVPATELLVQQAANAFALIDPQKATVFVPVCYDPYMPMLTASYDNNPSPSGVTNTNSVNLGTYVNTSDNTHEFDFGVNFGSMRMAQLLQGVALPAIR